METPSLHMHFSDGAERRAD